MSDAQRARTDGGMKPGFVVCIDLFSLMATQQLAAPAEGEAPRITIPLLPEGEFDHPMYGELSWTQAKFGQMKANFDSNVLGYCPSLNFDHRAHSWLNTDSKAAAWFSELVPVPGKGLDAIVELTPCGAEAIRNREYRYISAEVQDLWNAPTGEAYANVIRGGALTNHPFHGMMEGLYSETAAGERQPAAYCFSEVGPGKFWAAVDRAAGDAPTQGGDMSQTQTKTRKFGDFLRSFLGLKEGATPEELHAAIDATELDETPAGTAPATVIDPAPAAAAGTDQFSALTKQVDQLSGQVSTMATELKSARESAAEANRQLAETHAAKDVDQLIHDGKITPAQRADVLDFAISDPVRFKKLYENAQPVIDLSQRGKLTNGGDAPEESDDAYLAEVNKKVATGMEYSDAADAVADENPQLYQEYVARRRQRR